MKTVTSVDCMEYLATLEDNAYPSDYLVFALPYGLDDANM